MKKLLLTAALLCGANSAHAALPQRTCDAFGTAYFTLGDAMLNLGDAQRATRTDESIDKPIRDAATIFSAKAELGEYATIFKLLKTLSANDCKVFEPQSRIVFDKAEWDSLAFRWRLPLRMTLDMVKAVEPNAPELNMDLYPAQEQRP